MKSPYLSTLLFVLLFLSLPIKISKACGPTFINFHGYSFLNLELIKDQATAPYLLGINEIFENYLPENRAKINDNLLEWQERFCGLVEVKDLNYFIYKADIKDLELLRTVAGSKNMPVPTRFNLNSFATYLVNQKCIETINYLIFAKRCEPYVIRPDAWGTGERDVAAMQALIKEGRREFKNTKSDYMRLRYAFQLIRLAHYSKDYEGTLKLYDFLLPKIDKTVSRMEESFLPWWILGHKAGALHGLGEKVEAAYLYAQIFQHCPSRRESALRSFAIKTDEEWKECLLMCKDDDERSVLYAIRAHAAEAKAVEEMEHIYELNPTNEFLEVLLLKEVAKMEKNLLGIDFNSKKKENQRYFNVPKSYASDYVIRLQKFARRVRIEEKASRLELWHIAEGYLEFLAGDYYAAAKTFKAAREKVKNKAIIKQLGIFELALTISSLETINDDVERSIYDILKDNEVYKNSPDFGDFLKDKLADLYQKTNHPGKAFLCQYKVDDLRPNPKKELLDDLLSVAQKEEKTQFERLLTEFGDDDHIIHSLWDIQASIQLSNYQLEAAMESLKEIPRTEWDDFGIFNPFNDVLNDCVHCLYRRDTSELYNKGELIQEILDLEYEAKGDFQKSALNYYRIGLAWYNMSYFGYSWQVTDYFRSGRSWSRLHQNKDGVFRHPIYPFGNKENTDVSQALFYFEKARQLAENPELKARATFMAAKCEQKKYFTGDLFKPEPCCNQIPKLPEQYLFNFSRLQELYADTEFYQRAIRECKYFEAYARR